MTKATSMNQIIGTMTGDRAIQFVFTLADDTKRTVTLDFYRNGSAFNGATYARMESAALRSVIKTGAEVKTFTHFIIK